jgi:hypothetical protein
MRRFALALAVITVVGGCVAGQSISGVLNMDVTIDPQGASIADFLDVGTRVTVTYNVGGWAFTTFTQLDDTGWIDQTFSAGGVLGMFAIGMDLNLDPAGAFETWNTTVGTTFGSVAFDFNFSLVDSDITFIAGASAQGTAVDVDFSSTFGGDDNDICDFHWARADVTFDFLFCCADVSAKVDFDCSGFDRLRFDVDDIAIPHLPWLTIDAELTFRMETKELVLSPNFDFDPGLCFDFYVSVEQSGSLALGDVHVDGIKLVCQFDRVTFTGISFWGATGKPGELGSYWQMCKLASNAEACCGALSFEGAIFFDEGSHNLLDVAALEVGLELELGSVLVLTAGVEADVDVGSMQLDFGFELAF